MPLLPIESKGLGNADCMQDDRNGEISFMGGESGYLGCGGEDCRELSGVIVWCCCESSCQAFWGGKFDSKAG